MNAQVQAALAVSAQLAALAPPSTDPLTAARNAYRQTVLLAGEPEPVYSIEDHTVETSGHQIPVRIYHPSGGGDLPGGGVLPGGRDLPAILFFHGGWFIAGDLETHDRPLRALANAAGCKVVAVDYRLAPEHPFPAAIEDAVAILRWVASDGAAFGVDRNRLILAGDSAGGTIATVLARKAAANCEVRILLQVLLYPVTDSSLQTASWREFAAGPVITREVAVGAWQMYVPNTSDRQNGDAAPIFATDLAGSASALIIIAENDPLRDEGLAYAGRLEQAGVRVKVSLYKGMPHGFFQMAGYIDEGKQVMAEVGRGVKEAVLR